MSMPSPNDLTTWKVTGQTEYTQVTGSGAPQAGIKVMFTTGQGHNGSVFIPAAQYNPANARRLIEAAAANMDAVGMLTGGAGGQ